MPDLIRELFGHQAWADSEIMRVVLATPGAEDDARIVDLLNHNYQVHRFFLSAVEGVKISQEKPKSLSVEELRSALPALHSETVKYLAEMAEKHLQDRIVVPWFPQFQPTCKEALVQAVMHSQHHRAQIASRVRELDGKPTIMDYIRWVAKGRPAPEWNEATSSVA